MERSKKVLLAEDNSINRKLIKLMVEKSGYSCSTAADGGEAIDTLKREHFDILLVDMHMPKKNGMEVVDEIKSSGRLSRLYIILITAGAVAEGEERFIEAGCDDFIAKPLDKYELKGKLDRAGKE
ncbi:MAG: response regulator [Spirochaetaceae bacterium]